MFNTTIDNKIVLTSKYYFMFRFANIVQHSKSISKMYYHNTLHDNIIRIGKNILQPQKILSIHARSSRMYLRYPYMLNIQYDEPSEDMILLPVGNILWIDEDYTAISYKYENKLAIKKFLDYVRQKAPNCKIRDDIT